MNRSNSLVFYRIAIVGLAVGTIAASVHYAGCLNALGIPISFEAHRWVAVVLIAILGGIQLVVSILMWTPWQKTALGILKKYEDFLTRFRAVGILQALVSAALLPFLTLGSTGADFADIIPRLWIFWAAVLGVAIALKTLTPGWEISRIYALTIIGVAVVFKLAAYIPDVSTYPFSLGWSESNRYYYASLLFSHKIWGRDLPLSPWHPSRYMLQSLPFFISSLPLWFHRLWQVLLWVLMPVLSGISFARRLPLRGRIQVSIFVAWVFLFFSQGPVYYHLHVCLIIIFLGFDSQRFWRSLIVLVTASTWAGISRVNWIPVPAFIAGAIYLIEMPVCSAKNIWKYLSRPFFWSLVGGVAAISSQIAYINISGHDVAQFGSSFTSNLLWYRLWPNETFKPGILPAILLVSAPLLFIIIIHLRHTLRMWHPIRILGLIAILFTLFVGGLAVSVKIGGGSNLHNMDAYIVLLLIVGTSLYYGQFSPESPTGSSPVFPRVSNWVLGFAIGIPVCLSLLSGAPIQRRNNVQVENALQELRRTTNQATMAGEDVLFISNRHLLLFDLISGVPLIEDYEKIELMEMAMAGNQVYLDKFYTDIANQRFAIIITDPIFTTIKDRHSSFSEENNVWVNLVALPLLDDYQQVLYFKEPGIQVLEPKQ